MLTLGFCFASCLAAGVVLILNGNTTWAAWPVSMSVLLILFMASMVTTRNNRTEAKDKRSWSPSDN